MKLIRYHEHAPGGYWVAVEVENAYTDGSSRFDRVFVPTADLRGKTAEERRQAIRDALDDDPLAGIAGQDADSAPTQTKAVLERRMEALYADWQRWKATRLEAQARSLAAGAITALTNREDAAWARYVVAIQAWRNAP